MSLAIDKQDNKNGAMPEIVIRNVPEEVYVHQLLDQELRNAIDITLRNFLLRVISQKKLNLMTWEEIFNKMATISRQAISRMKI
jgi:hypothetical protein